jgi:CDP-glucose 4,6-dehydratase
MEGLEMSNGFWFDRPVLVTGATGLVGGWVVRRLIEAGADVVCLVRDWVPTCVLFAGDLAGQARIVRGDVRDMDLLERALGEYEIDTLFHLAAQTIVGVAQRNPVSTFQSNIEGTWSVLEASRRSPAVRQIVVASSDKAYGDHGEAVYDEDTPLEGRNPYDVSKSCADLLAQTYGHAYGLPVAVTRCGNFFGGGDLNWNRLVPGTIRSALRGERPVIRSDGSYVRDYVYVEDGAAAYVLLAERLAGEPSMRGRAFNFSYDSPMTVLEMTRRILDLTGCRLEPDVRGEASGEIRHQSLASGRARRELGWRPLFTLDEGLNATIEWYRNFFGSGANGRRAEGRDPGADLRVLSEGVSVAGLHPRRDRGLRLGPGVR